MSHQIIVLPGDGVGLEVTAEAVRVVEWFAERRGLAVTLRHELYGEAAYREHGALIADNSLFGSLRRSVMLHADQTPEYADVRKAGHDGGDFLFVRRN